MYGGTSYYWRGATTTNYLRFGGYCWRMIRINGDGSIRLIYDGTTCHNNGESTTDSIAISKVAYNTNYNNSSYVGWTYVENKQRPESGDTPIDSNAKTNTEEWYNNNIGNNEIYSLKVADGKFCNDRNTQDNEVWRAIGESQFYAGYKRLYTDYAPTLSCNSGDIYNLKVGLIITDEVELAGGKNQDNNLYYLYNGQNYWTMSPYWWDINGWIRVFRVDVYGHLANDRVSNTPGLRPVINLRSDVTLTGIGTIDSPFVVEGAE